MSTEATTAPILMMTDITKTFGGVQALKKVNFDLKAGEVQALIGQNGAGKSTLIKILAGAVAPDAGSIRFANKEVSLSSPSDALHLGIGTVYQDPLVYPELTVTENIFMGRELRDRYGNIDMQVQVKEVQRLLQDLDVSPQLATQPIGHLSVALRQLALIAKPLSWKPEVMVFDEPTAILTQHEAEILFSIIRRLRDRGIGIIYISHRLEEIYSLADRVTILKDGECKGTWPIYQIEKEDIAQHDNGRGPSLTADQMIELMAGQLLQESVTTPGARSPEPLLTVRNLSRKGVYHDISFEVHPGEIVGFFGLVGAGRSEVARAIFGEEVAEEGEIFLNEEKVSIRTPREALNRGIAYLPEDRKGQGLFSTLSVNYNTVITVMQRLATLKTIVQPKREETLTQQYIHDLAIKTPNSRVNVANLSGGNQQKVVLARWLATQPRVLVLDEPTAGVDVAAKQEIHNLIIELARQGTAIMLISSELQEVLKLSDRTITMHEGHVTGEFPRNTPAHTVLAAAMEGGTSTTRMQTTTSAASISWRDRLSTMLAHPQIRPLLTSREFIVLALLIVGSIVFNFTHPTFLSWNNILSILSNVAVVAIIAIGMTAVIVTGGIDVSVGSVLALCMLIAAKVIAAGMENLLVVLLVTLLVGLLMGLINGSLVAFGRIHPIIVTLGTLNIIRALHIQILGPQWLTPPSVVRPLSLGTFLGIPFPFWLVVALIILVSLFLRHRPLGRYVYALGGNTEAARLAGINIRGTIIFVYALIGLLIGLAAVIQLGLSGTVQPNAGTGLELQVIAATVIGGTNILGGRGTVIGSLLGALLVEVVHNALITIGTIALLEGLVIGTLIILAVSLDFLRHRKEAFV
ncbi:ATP-binding cassette domain-containing protein [Reticulibacter mediterranei]|nr:ATP-binding cassette domain-containing protein [Reticulibacter mediterranei]